MFGFSPITQKVDNSNSLQSTYVNK